MSPLHRRHFQGFCCYCYYHHHRRYYLIREICKCEVELSRWLFFYQLFFYGTETERFRKVCAGDAHSTTTERRIGWHAIRAVCFGAGIAPLRIGDAGRRGRAPIPGAGERFSPLPHPPPAGGREGP